MGVVLWLPCVSKEGPGHRHSLDRILANTRSGHVTNERANELSWANDDDYNMHVPFLYVWPDQTRPGLAGSINQFY